MRRNYSSDSLKRSVTPTATSSASAAAAARKRELEEAKSATAKSTPVRKPNRNNISEIQGGNEEEEDGEILKRMEEILMTYKSKVRSGVYLHFSKVHLMNFILTLG